MERAAGMPEGPFHGPFRFVDTSSWVLKLRSDLLAVFQADGDVRIVGMYKLPL